MKVDIENHIIEFNVQYAKRKKISLQIDALGLITVKVPRDTSEEIIISAVEGHGKWILEKLHN
ncbi:MAG: M48 family metallopeptidase, partial [Gorillibacterium sp.]|nr:M48 family metallopeptidase [Gorillibacterium sp.]